MRYPFMREFNGVPLGQTEAQRHDTRLLFLETARMLFARYIDGIGTVVHNEPAVAAGLYLHDPRSSELVVVTGSVDPRGMGWANITLADTVAATSPRTQSVYRDGEKVIRDQIDDYDAWTKAKTRAAFERIERRVAGLPEEPSPSAAAPLPDELSRGAVDLNEVTGLYNYLDGNSAVGLYVPVRETDAMHLQVRRGGSLPG